MVREIRIYVEGGGDGRQSKAMMRIGFDGFFSELKVKARSKRIRWSIIACGSRNSTYEDFMLALKSHPDAFNVLLVDSESTVTEEPRLHLVQQDRWDIGNEYDQNCNLMAQATEAWLIADIDALKSFYGKGFRVSGISKTNDVETLSTGTLFQQLHAATRRTQKGKYHKIHHCRQLLSMIDSSIVRNKARHCDRIFRIITEKMDAIS